VWNLPTWLLHLVNLKVELRASFPCLPATHYPTAMNLVNLWGGEGFFYVHITISQPTLKELSHLASFQRWRELKQPGPSQNNIFALVQLVVEIMWLAFVSLVGVSRSWGVGMGHP
jgi:hypothetical protein